MSTKEVKLSQAEKMLTYLKIDTEGRRILVRFADGKEGWIPVEEIEKISPEKQQLDLEEVNLPNPYEIEIGTREGETIEVPWDFARHYCDRRYKEQEIEKRDEGRTILGDRVARVRKGEGMTQKELSKSAGVGRVTISRIENGEQSPQYSTLEKLAEALGVEVSQFLSD